MPRLKLKLAKIIMKTYKAAPEFKGKGDSLITFPIHELDDKSFGHPRVIHANKIHVFDDVELRDRIVELLNKDNAKTETKVSTATTES